MLILLPLERSLYAVVITQPTFPRSTLVIGAGWAGHTIVEGLANNGQPCYEIVGFVDDDPAKQDSRSIYPVLGNRDALPDLICHLKLKSGQFAAENGTLYGRLLPYREGRNR